MWLITRDGPLAARLDAQCPDQVVVVGPRRAVVALTQAAPDAAVWRHGHHPGLYETTLTLQEWTAAAGMLVAAVGTHDLAQEHPHAWSTLFRARVRP